MVLSQNSCNNQIIQCNSENQNENDFTHAELWKQQKNDQFCIKIKEKDLDEGNYEMKNLILCKNTKEGQKIALPRKQLYELFIKYHDHSKNKLYGKDDIIKLFHKKYYRPDLGRLIKNAVENCPHCQTEPREKVQKVAEYLDSTKTSTVESTDNIGTYPSITPLTNRNTKPESNPDYGQRKCNNDERISQKRDQNINGSSTYKQCSRTNYRRQRPFYHIGEMVHYRQNGATYGPYKILSISRSHALLRHINKGPTFKTHLNYLIKDY